jgi:hypothetical protein
MRFDTLTPVDVRFRSQPSPVRPDAHAVRRGQEGDRRAMNPRRQAGALPFGFAFVLVAVAGMVFSF